MQVCMSDQSFFLTADAVVETVVSETTDHQQTLTHEYRGRESSEIYRPKLVQYNDNVLSIVPCSVYVQCVLCLYRPTCKLVQYNVLSIVPCSVSVYVQCVLCLYRPKLVQYNVLSIVPCSVYVQCVLCLCVAREAKTSGK